MTVPALLARHWAANWSDPRRFQPHTSLTGTACPAAVRDRTDQPDLAVQAHLAGLRLPSGLDRLGMSQIPVKGGAGRRDQLPPASPRWPPGRRCRDGQRWRAGGHVFTQRRVTAIVESVDALLPADQSPACPTARAGSPESGWLISGRSDSGTEQVARQSVSLGAAGLGCSLHEGWAVAAARIPGSGAPEPARARVTVHGQQGLGRDQSPPGRSSANLHHLGTARAPSAQVGCVDRHTRGQARTSRRLSRREGRDQHTRSGDGPGSR